MISSSAASGTGAATPTSTPREVPGRTAILRERLHLTIPPAWTDVHVAPLPNMHIQACGVDAAGRVQYIYHPDWEARRARHKQKQLSMLAAALPKIRRRVTRTWGQRRGARGWRCVGIF